MPVGDMLAEGKFIESYKLEMNPIANNKVEVHQANFVTALGASGT